jgi:galactonate dehydratase
MNISQPDLKKALEPFRRIRAAVGDKMDIMAEFHSLWNLPTAKRIFDALDEISCFWYEDPIKMNNLDALAELAGYTRVPICASETLATRFAFRELMARQAAGIIMLDISWCGGLSEAKKIATMAEAHNLPVAPHDCTGPVVLAVSTALSLNAPNALIQEVVRAFYTGWYRDVVTEVNRVANSYIYPLTDPGLGLTLRPDLLKRPDVTIRGSGLKT